MIRDEFSAFVDLWNGHKIRVQKNRPNVVSGIPMDLYRTENVRNWGVYFEDDDACGERVRTMLEPLEDVDIDRFMTPATTEWCDQQLEVLGFDGIIRTAEGHDRPHLQFYIQLRELVRDHIRSGQEPQLELISVPEGGIERYVSTMSCLHTLI